MVLKRRKNSNDIRSRFENDVKKYGTQTPATGGSEKTVFENDVKKYGTQTILITVVVGYLFENDVKKYGTQTGEYGGINSDFV